MSAVVDGARDYGLLTMSYVLSSRILDTTTIKLTYESSGGAIGHRRRGELVGERAVRVFCSHCRPDKAGVEAFARRLRADGIEAWLDRWEIAPGADVVKAIEAGLDECDVGLVFLSSTKAPGGVWMGAEVSTLTADRLEGRLGRIIPVLLDPDAPVPALLLSLDRRPVDDYEAIRDAILGWRDKPPLGTMPGQAGGGPEGGIEDSRRDRGRLGRARSRPTPGDDAHGPGREVKGPSN